MTYSPEKPRIAESSDQLRARIPGWGADLDPANRPSVPKERFDPGLSGAHWSVPEQQPERWPRERSVEHAPRGLSGVLRRYTYKKYSEGRAAHWLLLMAADRVDTLENTTRSMVSMHPDNLITETGVVSEFTHHGLRSRLGRGRTDLKHQWLDPFIVAGPWIVAGAAGFQVAKGVRRRLRRSS
jgi:hypothetical protein